ncbi:acetyltransferase [Pseudaeromonas paramecii]|uniref:Acetyltransferase n=1 Tax=Pseudaeromonas paramecii TaxID=2138166 RepID=A0ABP8Q5Q3_9GAMM
MKPVLLLGGGGHAAVVLDVLTLCDVPMAGYLAPSPGRLDLPYLGDDSLLSTLSPSDYRVALGVGSTGVMPLRRQLFERAKRWGFECVTLIHPRAIVARSAVLAEGVQVMAGAVIQPGCHLHENVLVNTAASVDHHCELAAHCHIAPGARLSGGVRLGALCHVGTGASLLQGITLGDHCLVAAGAVVLGNWPAGSRVKGIPATQF